MSTIRKFTVNTGTLTKLVTVTAQRNGYDYNGNPMWLIQVWTSGNNGHIWYPKIKGYRDRKDMFYRVQSHDIEKTLLKFIKDFEKQVSSHIE